MAEKLVSAGVFTRENDLSFLPQGISAIGATIIGPTQKGPAFVPTIVDSATDFVRKFGDAYEGSYVPYTVKNYLKNSGTATVVRVAGLSGYTSDAIGIEVSGSGQSTTTFGLSVSTSGSNSGISLARLKVTAFNTSSTDITLVLSSSITASYNVSLNSASSSYISTVLGTNADDSTAYFYVSSTTGSLGNSLSFSNSSQPTVTGSIISTVSRSIDTGSSGVSLVFIGTATLANTRKTIAVLTPSTSSFATTTVATSGINTSSLSFVLTASSATTTATYSLSLDPANANYIANVLGKSPSNKKWHVYANYLETHTKLKNFFTTSSADTLNISATLYDTSDSEGLMLSGKYSEAFTPWIKSQTIDSQKINLFKIWTFNAGRPTVKVSISEIRRADEIPGYVADTTYGTFTLTVRDVDDTDDRPIALETYSNITLDPASPNYICRAIGDQYKVFGEDADGNSKIFTYGDYPNVSKYIRIEMSGESIPTNALPFGFASYILPISNGSGGTLTMPTVKYSYSQMSSNGGFNFRKYLGFDFTVTENENVYKPVATSSAFQVSDSIDFNLEYCLMANTAQTAETDFSISSDTANAKKARKFSVAFQGGWDGFDPTVGKYVGENMVASNIMGFDCSTPTSTGVTAYKKAIDTVSNPDEYDFNLLLLPGITNDLAGSIITYADSMCQDRQDVFFLFDCVTIGAAGSARKTVTNAVSSVIGIDSNYSATYYPWVKTFDNVNNKYIWVPPSVVLAEVISFNDKVAAEWWAPAGFNRGGIDAAVDVASKLTQAERNTLSEGRVNPIAHFSGLGYAAWGQKTLQVKNSALDRINVRRLLIAVKKFIASATKYLVFEHNTNATRQKFLNIVNPYLSTIQQKQGLYAFKAVMDDTTNTADVIDRNQMVGAIYLQPTKVSEIIIIDFNILPTGATFSQ